MRSCLIIFFNHSRLHELIGLLKGAYTVRKEQDYFIIDDYRFSYFYSEKEKNYFSVFSYLVFQNAEGGTHLSVST